MARWLLIAVAIAGCSRASNEGEAKKWQEAPPPKEVVVPDGLSITVVVNVFDHPPITTAVLKETKPDFADAEHRAWRIATLVAAAGVGSTIEASSSQGVAVKFMSPTPEGFEPVLFLTRRGDIIVTAIDPKDPFPRFHGQGSRLRRPGDTMPRVTSVTKLTVFTQRKP
jgi:hypothetical protein